MNSPYWTAFLAFFLALCLAASAHGEDRQYLAEEELTAELQSREADIERTNQRISELTMMHTDATVALESAEMDLLETEKNLSRRAGLLYRLSHHGKAIRYLLYATSATGLLKRLETLKFLVISEMKARRAAGLRVAQTQDRVTTLGSDLVSARLMLDELTQIRDELLSEQRTRETAPALANR